MNGHEDQDFSLYIYISRLLRKKSLAVVGGAFNLPLFHWQEPFPSQIEFWKQFVFFLGGNAMGVTNPGCDILKDKHWTHKRIIS